MASLERPGGTLSAPARFQDEKAPAVSLRGVTRMFGVTAGVVRVDLRIERGETVLLRGPNGAGKTTLLRLVATAISPTFGTGSVLGLDLISQRGEIRRRAELLGHRTRLYEDLTGEENLRFVCRLWRVDPTAIPAVLEKVGLSAVSGDRVRTYSHGMRQRVAVGRALLRSSDLLLLDEPYAGLDSGARELVDDAVVEAQGKGRTVVLATHDETRGKMAHRVVHMEGGRLLPDLGLEASESRSSERSGTC